MNVYKISKIFVIIIGIIASILFVSTLGMEVTMDNNSYIVDYFIYLSYLAMAVSFFAVIYFVFNLILTMYIMHVGDKNNKSDEEKCKEDKEYKTIQKTNMTFKKCIHDIRNMYTLDDEMINNIRSMSSEEKMEIIRSYNVVDSFAVISPAFAPPDPTVNT